MTRAAAGVLAVAAIAAAPAHASSDATLLSVNSTLDKTTYGGLSVGGLSALAFTSSSQALALTDNQGATPARFFTLKVRGERVETTKVTTLKRVDGTPFTGQNLDGEGLVVEPDGNLLISSETEPVIRRFDRDGDQLAQLSTPPRFGIAPNGQATTNQAFEGLAGSEDGRTLFAGMEGALSADGTGRLRLIRYDRPKRGDFVPTTQYAYKADENFNLVELAVVDEERLLVMERKFLNNQWGIRVYEAYLGGAQDVSSVAALSDSSPFIYKRLLLDVTDHTPLIDNIEGLALGGKLADGRRELTLISDDNFSASQATRVYRFAVKLHREPVLEGRALYSATQYQPGPTSGNSGVGANNGVVPPFPGQPIPGFSGALYEGGNRFLAMPDNGFGTKGNSRDFLLRVYKIEPNWLSHKIEVKGFLSLRDPDKKIPFEIVNQTTKDRLLTGGDFDIEAIARDRRGDLWFGEEFGPYLLHTDATGKVLDAPIALPGAKSPSSPDLQPGEQPTIQGSRGWEAVASSQDGRTLYPIVEGYRLDDTNQLRRYIYEFDVASKRYTGRKWAMKTDAANLQIGDAQAIGDRELLVIERDDLEGAAAKIKNVVKLDLGDVDTDGFVRKEQVLDLLRVRDPFGIGGLGDPFRYPIQSLESIVPIGKDRLFVVNDNNFPDSNGRVPGQPDDVEAIIVRLPDGFDG
ncbi:esterase-like activity of phytase family protein [Solirubrobacter phytolaccae]|uniref:Esterase-like activity of phytase family protein n=2 Tax=Solirubrobacter phytolaccae TaxID=1404360 RepID=A0A9X3N6N0_9ACTN|nr:esterase-like activity of phytase family protein [Solirubrobacter phytolaccae]